MANRRGHRGRGGRPHRGGSGNVIIEGDTGIAAGPQGGAAPGATESGDLAAREFGTPQVDIPGGVKHLVNPETKAAETVAPPPRPADYHKEHGVEPADWGDYVTPPDAGDEGAGPPKAEPVPKADDAIPVYIVQRKGDAKRIRALVTDGPETFASGTTDPVRLANRDPARIKFWVCNENTSAAGAAGPGVRIGDWETVADGRGLLVPAAQIKDFVTQDAVFMTNQSGTAVTLSWGYETEIAAARPEG